MKLNLRILVFVFAALLSTSAFISCSDDDFGPSIFDTQEHPLDRTVYTFPLDTFIKKNFLEKYNMRYYYRLEDIMSDKQKNLVPASYEASKKLAVLTKYLWYEVYEDQGDEDFMKKNSPRIILLTGSPSVNATSHTETLGTAEGGLKIYLYKVNSLDENNIDHLNKYFFHTMHHEFAHILDQNNSRPQAFNLLSNGKYDPMSWGEAHDSLKAGQGFVTPYASSAAGEDWVETLSCYVGNDSLQWARLLSAAHYEWESIDLSNTDSINTLYRMGANVDSVGYIHTVSSAATKLVRKVIKRNADGSAALDADGNIVFDWPSGIKGDELILQKLQMVREWLLTYYHIDIDKMRDFLQKRTYVTDENGHFVLRNGSLVNRLTQPSPEDPSKTIMEKLLEQVDQYESLMIKD
ncbi:MAG: hypothetical protein K6C10_09065 [Prevotella sp.]|nr:hypothetical protein [Prevotella sp.]